MKIAITGGTGFLGRYIVNRLATARHECRCWYRPSSDRGEFEALADRIEWQIGELGDAAAAARLVAGCDAVVHAALYRTPGNPNWIPDDIVPFVEQNLLGSLQLMQAAVGAGVGRFIYISSCAVHDRILSDRPLDETHPTWASNHYGAHKAAIEQFVHSYGFGQGYPICALRPCGIYGVARPVQESKWFDLVSAIARGGAVHCDRGGKEVHAADVARASELLLTADGIAGEAFNCCDRYISQWDVATIAKRLSGSGSVLSGGPTSPKNQIVTAKIERLGMTFGGESLLERTIGELLAAAE